VCFVQVADWPYARILSWQSKCHSIVCGTIRPNLERVKSNMHKTCPSVFGLWLVPQSVGLLQFLYKMSNKRYFNDTCSVTVTFYCGFKWSSVPTSITYWPIWTKFGIGEFHITPISNCEFRVDRTLNVYWLILMKFGIRGLHKILISDFIQ
jgi:hypothetical protein